jgi:hypothetical protein
MLDRAKFVQGEPDRFWLYRTHMPNRFESFVDLDAWRPARHRWRAPRYRHGASSRH